jgi:hypothetical protein
MEHNCERHPFEVAGGTCRSCQGSFCPDCLLYAFGPDQEPYCKACAITAGGVRSTARNRRRVPAEPIATTDRTRGRSGGFFSRLRGKQDQRDEVETLEPEELFGQDEADEFSLLEAQRLPSQPDEEPEPEPSPTPNIAPPAPSGEEPELVHRALADEVAGGLDLSGADDPRWSRRGTGDTGEPALPPVGPEAQIEPADPVTPADPTTLLPEPPEPPTPTDSPSEPAAPTTPLLPEPPEPAAADTFTADGTPLFAAESPAEDRLEPAATPPAPNDPPPVNQAPPEQEPAAPTTGIDDLPPLFAAEAREPTLPDEDRLEPAAMTATGPTEHPPVSPASDVSSEAGPTARVTVTDEDTLELLRRIADLTRP